MRESRLRNSASSRGACEQAATVRSPLLAAESRRAPGNPDIAQLPVAVENVLDLLFLQDNDERLVGRSA